MKIKLNKIEPAQKEGSLTESAILDTKKFEATEFYSIDPMSSGKRLKIKPPFPHYIRPGIECVLGSDTPNGPWTELEVYDDFIEKLNFIDEVLKSNNE